MVIHQRSWTVFLGLVLSAGPLVAQSGVPAQSTVDGAAQSAQVRVAETQGEPLRVTVHPGTIGYFIDEFAGLRVRVPNARVASILDPRAFVIEWASRHDVGPGFRDRTLVLLDGASLRVTEEQLAGSTVTVLGVATTLAGSRLLATSQWPVQLDRERVDQLEVRAVVVATSVQTAEGTQLTN
jgi:hypothetical protein